MGLFSKKSKQEAVKVYPVRITFDNGSSDSFDSVDGGLGKGDTSTTFTLASGGTKQVDLTKVKLMTVEGLTWWKDGKYVEKAFGLF